MDEIVIGDGDHRYVWKESWFQGDHHYSLSEGFAHHGIAVTKAGDVVTFHEQESAVLIFDSDGSLRHSFGVPLVQGHGMLLVEEQGEEFLWIADSATKRVRKVDGSYAPFSYSTPLRGQAVKVDLQGNVILRLEVPGLEVYLGQNYAPTSVAVDEESRGGSDDIWIADGYGQDYVHRYNKNGEYKSSMTGEEGAGKFRQAHAVFIDRRHDEPELYVADRLNGRVQVFDLDGSFRRSFGEGLIRKPSAFSSNGDLLAVADLQERVVLFDLNDSIVGDLGQFKNLREERPGWPNMLKSGGPVRPDLSGGYFNSPHGIAFDNQGNLYVSEWLIGGRLVQLTKI